MKVVFWAVLCVEVVVLRGQIDLNEQQIQFVADHLSDNKCDELMYALSQKDFLFRQTPSPRATTTKRPDDVPPCVDRLTSWLRGPGRNLTHEYLTLRLKEIGFPELAKTLGRAVMKETSNELHKFFLDDPFKEMIPTESIMFDKPEQTTKLVPAKQVEDREDTLFIVILVLGALALVFLFPLTICLVCPRATLVVCHRACPAFCALCCEIQIDGCQRIWRGSRQAADRYLFVAPKRGGGGFMV